MRKIYMALMLCCAFIFITACGVEKNSNKNSELEMEMQEELKSEISTEEVYGTQYDETEDLEVEIETEIGTETGTWTIKDMNKTMYVKADVNVRKGPNTSYEKIGILSTNDSILVTGQCNETNWYRILYNDECAYVSNQYLLEEPLPVVQEIGEFLSGKKLSIMGDSISTYIGYSNDATNANSTIGNNSVWYTGEHTGVSNVNQTWWKKTADETGMEILVNNSWSGSQVFSGEESDAYRDRAENLHDNTGENTGVNPDIIAVFIGINDFVRETTFGTYGDELYDELIQMNEDGTREYKEPNSFVEAYIIMIDKIVNRYTGADVFLFTFLPNGNERFSELEEYNAVVCNVAKHYNLLLVDLYNDSEITKENYTKYYGDGHIHPNKDGMEAIKKVFVEVLKEKYLE